MKIRSFTVIRMLAFLLSLVVRVLVGSVRYYYRPRGPAVQPSDLEPGQRVIYCFWHDTLLLPAGIYGRRDIHVLISEHADGELIARAVQHLGFSCVRGSATRSGLKAMFEMIGLSDTENLVITPDGPRGPRRKVKPGVIRLASKTGLPIVPVGWAFSGAWRMGSWDRFAIPHPGTAGYGVTGDFFWVPPNISNEEMEDYRARLEVVMHDLQAEAEHLSQQLWQPHRPKVVEPETDHTLRREAA